VLRKVGNAPKERKLCQLWAVCSAQKLLYEAEFQISSPFVISFSRPLESNMAYLCWRRWTSAKRFLLAVCENAKCVSQMLSSTGLVNFVLKVSLVSYSSYCSTSFYFLWLYSLIQALAASIKLSIWLQLLDLGQSVEPIGRVISSSQTEKNAHTTQILNIHAQSWIRTHGPGVRAGKDSSWFRRLGYRDRLSTSLRPLNIFNTSEVDLSIYSRVILHYCRGFGGIHEAFSRRPQK
jgi:hypothetical protein